VRYVRHQDRQPVAQVTPPLPSSQSKFQLASTSRAASAMPILGDIFSYHAWLVVGKQVK